MSGAQPSPSLVTSLRHRVVKAGAWTLAGYALSQLIRFGSNIIMTRLLAPEMFGVMAIAWTVLVGFALFFDVGLRPNVVHSKRGVDEAFLNTAWIIQFFHGLIICLGALLVAGGLLFINSTRFAFQGTVFADPTLAHVIIGVSVVGIVSGLQSTKTYEASRDLLLNRITQIELVSQVIGLLCMIAYAYESHSIWALVVGAIASKFVSMVLSHIWLPGTNNSWRWDTPSFKEIIHFGKWIFLSSIVGFFVGNGDRLLLGYLVSPTVLGAYAIAFVIFSSVDGIATKIISEISFPALSEVARDRAGDLKNTYFNFHKLIAPCAYFSAGVLMTSGQAVVDFIYDPRYHDAGWMLQILAVTLAAIPFRLATQLYMVFGVPRLYANLLALRLITLLLFTPIGFTLAGMTGALWGIVLSHYSGLPFILIYMSKHGLFDIRREILFLPILPISMAIGELIKLVLA